MKKIKEQKGSITLFVIIAMLFFVLFLSGAYMISSSKEQTGISETRRIKEIYEKDINRIDDVYQTAEEGLKRNLKDVIQIGDYVAYDPTKGVANKDLLSYTSEVGTGMSHGNGHSSQTFTATSETKWRVLSKDKTTGEVVLISDVPIKTDEGSRLGMYGAIGYLYAEQELNEICKIYGYGTGADTSKTFNYQIGDELDQDTTGNIKGSGARSITVEDIDKITKYDPATYTTEKDGIRYKYGDSYTHTIYHPTKENETGASATAVKRTDKWTAYTYQGSEYLTDRESAIYQMLYGNNDLAYWLASRGIKTYSDITNFYVFAITEGNVCNDYICGGYSDRLREYEQGVKLSVRPVVYLKSNIQTSTKDASGAWMISE